MSAPVHLPGFLRALAPLLDHWGYVAVAFLLFVEDFGVPAPGETVLIAASVYAGAGRLNIVALGVIAFAAAVLGDNTGYAIGRFGGRTLVLRYGRYVRLTEERLDKAESFFTRRGGAIVTVARFIEGLRQANGIVAQDTPTGVVALSTGDAWAVGETLSNFTTDTTLALHWDGTNWQIVGSATAGTGSSFFTAVTGTAPGQPLWAVGQNGSFNTLIETASG